MNYIEEVKKFELIKNSKAYDLAKIEVLLRLDKVYIWTKDGHIAVLSSNTGDKSIYIYTDKELIPAGEENYEEFSLYKFIIVLKNRNSNFNSCYINNKTEYSSVLVDDIYYIVDRYNELYKSVDNIQKKPLELKDRNYIVAIEALDENNIDVLTRDSGDNRYIYVYTDSELARNKVYMEQLGAAKLIGLNKDKLNKLVTNLSNNGINKAIINFGTDEGLVISMEELIKLLQ